MLLITLFCACVLAITTRASNHGTDPNYQTNINSSLYKYKNQTKTNKNYDLLSITQLSKNLTENSKSNSHSNSNSIVYSNSKSISYANSNINYLLLNNFNDFSTIKCSNDSSECKPHSVSNKLECKYIHECCSDTISVGIIDYLTFQYCTMNEEHTIGILIQIIILIYLFGILANIADDYFAPTMGEMADTLGVSHNVAGVTFLAFGNGAPDISSSISAIRHGGNQTLLGLGALLGAAVFDPIAVSAVITTVCNNPKVARRPFLRDCLFLMISVSYVLFITQDGTVTIVEATSLWLIYVAYVSIVVIGEAYKKWSKKQRRKKRRLARKRQKEKEVEEYTITDRIMPKLAVFSNESMGNLFAGLDSPTSTHSPQFSAISGISGTSSTPRSFVGGGVSNMSAEDITHGAPQLYHKLLDQEHEQRKEARKRTRTLSVASTVASSDEMDIISSESSDVNRPLYLKILFIILRGPLIIIDILCIITIPMVDKNWNDKLAPLWCLTSPFLILFAFDLYEINIKIGTINTPIYVFVEIIFLIPSILSFIYIRKKQEKYRRSTIQQQINKDKAENTIDTEPTTGTNITETLVTDDDFDLPNPGYINDKGLSLLHNNNNNNNNNNNDEYAINKTSKKIKNKKEEKEIPIDKQPVFKVFFLFLGFLSATGWIELVANELVNLLTTLGVVSTINLDILGLTVLAWGNSVGDMIADVSVSKRGYSKMGIGAAIGGPTLNVLIGVGLGFTIRTLSVSNHKVDVSTNSNVFVSCLGVLIGIGIYVIVVPITGWKLNKWFGYWCYFYYTAFLVINVLVFLNIM